ncbi:SpoIIE family protein phosphatase [Leptospira sp. 96542]|nr:SpoIIE family protein phosphatase [Leptospira sp. 96542]
MKEVKPYIENPAVRFFSISLFVFFFFSFCGHDPRSFSRESQSLSVLEIPREYKWLELDSEDLETFNDSDWLKFNTNTLGFENNPGKILVIRFNDGFVKKLNSPVLYAEIALEQFRVYQGNEIVYTSELNDHIFPHIIPLKNISSGFIYICFRSRYKGFIGMDRNVTIKDHSLALTDLFLENFTQTFLAPVLLVLGSIFLGFYFLRRRERIFLNFSILLFSASIIEAMNGFVGFALKEYSYLTIPLTFINFSLFPLFLLLFLHEIYPPFFKNLFRIFLFLHIIVFFIAMFKNYKGSLSYLNGEYDYNWLIVVEGIVAIFSSLYVLWRGQKHLRIITFGLLCIVFAGLHDILLDLGMSIYHNRIIHFGFWAMIVLFGFYVFRHYWQLLGSIASMNDELRIKNKELERLIHIDKDLNLAQALQNSLISTNFEEDEHVQIIGFSQTLESVGGDYFDHTKDSLGNWAILMTDVSGHGISSAMVAAMSKMAFGGAVPYLQFPSRVFHLMNRYLVGKTKNLFITASYLFIDVESYSLSFSNAGHPGFFLLRKSENEVFHFTTKGKPLGIFLDIEFSEGSTILQPGDRLLLYTDGILDMLDENEESFGEERLKKVLWENRFQNFQNLANILQESMYRFSNGWKHQMDDLSFLLIEMK